MYDIYFSLDATKISRDFVLHEKINFIAPDFVMEQYLECFNYDTYEFENIYGTVTFTLTINEVNYELAPNESLELDMAAGDYEIGTNYSFVDATCELNEINYFNVQVRKSNQPYLEPDDVWEVTLDQNFLPPISKPYPENSPWAKYNNTSNGKAIATIKLGEGNTALTRPIIFVDGVDFGEYEVIDPNINKIVRYGSTGWENVCQGLLSKKTGINELELFENYPNFLNNLLTEQDDQGESNYDVILVEFEDGADYIQKNAKLLQKVIERVNDEKLCGYQNLILGLSMGGQVSRFALKYMEQEGIDHQCRQYISFDSPHIYANIPLAVQAFVYSGAHFLDNKTAIENWYGLNRPAAIQMLKYNLMGEIESGSIHYSHANYSYTLDASNLLTEHLEYIPFKSSTPKANELREQYSVERSSLGFPEMVEKLAIANGSGIGENNFDSEVLAFLKNESQDIIFAPFTAFTQLIIDHIIENNEDEFFKLKLNTVGTEQQNIFEFNFFDGDNLEFNKVRVSNNTDLWEVDNAPGCSRNDLTAIIDELETLVKNGATSNSGWSSLFLDFELELYEKQFNSTFMPSASVLGVESGDLDLNLTDEIMLGNIKTPFEFIYLPVDNEPHVYSSPDNTAFLLSHVNDNMWQYGDEFIIPDATYGNVYNYGYLQNKLRSFTVNKGGELKVNNTGATGFVEHDPEHDSHKEYFYISTINSNCNTPAQLVINSDGIFELGDSDDENKSGNVDLLEGSNLIIKNGGNLQINNSSSLNIFNGAQATFESGANILLNGKYSTIVVKKGGKLIINGGLNLEFIGENSLIRVEKGGHIQFIGDQNLVLPKNTNNISIDGIFEYNGKFELAGEGKFIFDYNVEIEGHDIFNFTGPSKNEISIISYGTSIFNEALQIHNCGIDGSLKSVSGGYNLIENCKIIFGRLSFTNYISTTIQDSDFSSGGISRLGNGGNMEILNCTFKISPSQNAAIDIDNEDSYGGLYVNESTFESKESDENGFAAFELYNVPFVWIDSSQISNLHYGLLGGDLPNVKFTGSSDKECIEGFRFFYKSNLFLEKGSSLIDNGVGIEMNGDYEYGLVSLNCASIILNGGYKVGIRGQDILLHMDAYQHAATSDGILRPNTFIRPLMSNVSKFFLINYQERNVDLINAKGNYWNGIDPSKYLGGAWNFEPFIPVNYVDFVEVMPDGCSSYGGGGNSGIFDLVSGDSNDSSECEMIFKEGTIIQDQFTNANQKLIEMEFDLAYPLFAELSELSDFDKIENIICKHYIDVSRAISSQYAMLLQDFENRSVLSYNNIEENSLKSNKKRLSEMNLKITPNPAHGIVYFSTGDMKEVDVFIVSTNGEVMYSGIIPNQLAVNIFNWNKGIYFVKYFNKENGMIYQDKLVVQ